MMFKRIGDERDSDLNKLRTPAVTHRISATRELPERESRRLASRATNETSNIFFEFRTTQVGCSASHAH